MVRACPWCLKESLRPSVNPTTVNDLLAALEAGPLPALPAAEAEVVARLLDAAAELYNDRAPEAARRVVRDVAKVENTTTATVMRWNLKRMGRGLRALSASLLPS